MPIGRRLMLLLHIRFFGGYHSRLLVDLGENAFKLSAGHSFTLCNRFDDLLVVPEDGVLVLANLDWASTELCFPASASASPLEHNKLQCRRLT